MKEAPGIKSVNRFVSQTRWEGLPSEVQDTARAAMLDALGATLIGTLTPIARITGDYACQTWRGDGATLLLDGRRTSAIGAAFANGFAANGIDIDDCGLHTKGHPGAQLFPASLALAESLGLGGAQMLAGMTVGYEVAHRAARIWHATHDVYQACGSWGSVACAALSANMMGLPEEQIAHALGIADYYAPNLPMMRDIDHPTMVKHGIGWGAMTGITAAQLAAGGFTGVPSLFGFPEFQDWVTDIGKHYIIAGGVIFKEYAACAWAHPAIDATRKLIREQNVEVGDIAGIRIEGFHETVRLGTRLPTTTEEAQFNVAWPLAVILIDGVIGPDGMLEHRFDDPLVRDLASRIEVVESDELNRAYELFVAAHPDGKYLSVSTIELKDGRTVTSGPYEGNIRYPQGWSNERVAEKFRWLAGKVLTPAGVDKLIDLAWHFEKESHASILTQTINENRLA